MADKNDFKPIGSKINRGIAILIYSDAGIGKTTLAGTLPVGETLFLNCEGGDGPLLGSNHIVMDINADNVDRVETVYKDIRAGASKYKWVKYVVFDNISEYEQWLVLSYTRKRGKESPELREYGDTSFKMKEIMHLYRDLVYSNITVILNAWEYPYPIKNNDGTVITKTFPKMGQKITGGICGIVDIVAHLEVHEKSGKRWLRIGPSDQYITKTQFKGLDDGEVADLPTLIKKVYAYDYKEAEG